MDLAADKKRRIVFNQNEEDFGLFWERFISYSRKNGFYDSLYRYEGISNLLPLNPGELDEFHIIAELQQEAMDKNRKAMEALQIAFSNVAVYDVLFDTTIKEKYYPEGIAYLVVDRVMEVFGNPGETK